MQQVTKQQVLDELRKQGITNLEQLAQYVEEQSRRTDEEGAPVVAATIINPHYFVTH